MSEERQNAVPPALPQALQPPGYVSNQDHIIFRQFNGIDTKSPRSAIDDRQMYWCDGFMPVGPSFLRILPGIGPFIFTAPAGTTIIWHQYGCIGSSPDPTATETDVGVRYYAMVELSDGSMQAINTDSNVAREIMPPGTIKKPRTQIGFSQWGSDYFLFCADQPNGYWIWDEHNLFTAGTFSPIIDVTSGGRFYTSPPTINVQTTSTNPNLGYPEFQAQLTPGGDSVDRIVVTYPGSGFTVDDFAILKFSGGGSDSTAWGVANISQGGGVKEIIVTNGGSGYTFKTQVLIQGGGGSNATASPNIQNGTIVSVTITNPGQDYIAGPGISVTDPGYSGIAGGSGFQGYAIVGLQGISSVTVTNGGSGYTDIPDVEIIGDGHGALFRAQIATGGVGEVTAINLINPGEGYTRALPLITGGNNAAEAANWQTMLMPFGWSGTTLEVYQARVWIANGAALADFPPRARLIWSAPENPASASLGAGSSIGSDDFLKIGWFSLKQSNGFLYLIADSSVNNISSVTTTTTGATAATATTPADPGTVTTVFANQNTDPQAGSPWPSSVRALNRTIIFANSDGIQMSFGGAVTKVSEVLDGILMPTPALLDRNADFSGAVAQVFGVQVYCLLIPHTDLYTSQPVTTMIMFDGQKFWSTPQDVQLTYIASQEILSQMIAWGTDGTNLFRLFQRPTTSFLKVVRSRLWGNPNYDWDKTAVRLYGIFHQFPIDQPVAVDIETNMTDDPTDPPVDPPVDPPTNPAHSWDDGQTRFDQQAVNWDATARAVSSVPKPLANGHDVGSPGFAGSYNQYLYTVTLNPTDPGMQTNGTAVFGPYPTGQRGRLIGLTLHTNATQGNLVSLMLREQDFVLNE